MRRSLTALLATPVLAGLLTLACGGGSGGGGSSTQYITQGAITHIGSVTAAGTVYDTDAAEVVIEPGDEGPLRVGKKVTVEGVPDAGDDAVSSATRVVYDDDLQGMVESVVDVAFDLDGDDATVAELEILDRTVVMTRGETLFEGTDFDFETIAPGDFVEVSGFEGADGLIVASWIGARNASDGVELKGVVSDLDADDFMLGGVRVVYDGVTTSFKGLDDDVFSPGVTVGDVENGDFVEVRGVFDDPDVDAAAGSIEIEQQGLEGSVRNAEIEGLVTDIGLTSFRVSGQLVTVGLGVIFEPSDILIDENVFVEVEGQLNDGVLAADVVRLRRGEARVAALLSPADVNTMAGNFTLLGDLEVQVNTATRFDCDDVGIDDLAGLAAAVDPVFVEVRGIDIGGQVGAMRAVTIACADETGHVELQGRLAQAEPEPVPPGAGTITILGVTFPVAGADFDFPPGIPVDEAVDFFLWAASNPGALLEVRDDLDDGIATDFDAADVVRCVDEDACP